MKKYKCTYCGCKEVPYDTQVCPECNLQPIPPFEEPILLKNIIGGLEEKGIIIGDSIKSAKNEGHNQLCNREVEVNEILNIINESFYCECKYPTSENDEGYQCENCYNITIEDRINLARALTKAISEGKVLRVKK